MSEATPAFSRHEGYEFKDGDKIYVIDDNNYDIWEAEIESVEDDGYHIHYPDYPNDDCVIENSSQFLVRDENNIKIFQKQEKIRQKKEKEEKKAKKENDDFEESDSDDNYQQKKKKAPKKKKKEKPKKEKPKKEKKEKPPKEPKPKKEPKQSKAKESKHKKITSPKEYRKIMHEAIKTAFQKGINDVDAFIHFFDNTYRTIYGDKQMNKIANETVQRFERELAKNQNNEQDGDEIDIDSTTDEGDMSDQDEEEDVVFDPEEITLPTNKGKIQDGYEISIANTSLSFNKNDPFPIIFDDDKCNAFIYKTPATQYLILNGMKFELERIDENENIPKFYFYDESKLPSHENQQSVSYFYPRIKKLGNMKVKESIECIRYMSMENKKKSKIGQLQSLPELEDDNNDSTHNSSKRKSRKAEADNSRVIRSNDLEDSDSD